MNRVLRHAARWVFALALCVAGVPNARAQGTQELEDVVYLKDGGIVRGIIMEQRPGESILIRTRDGNQFRYAMSVIDRITKEPPIGRPQPAAAPAQQQVPVMMIGGKSGGTAALLSFLLTGAGQFYNGQAGKGFVMLSLGVVGAAMMFDGTNEFDCDPFEDCAPWLLPAGAVLAVTTKIWSIADAASGSGKWNRAHGYAARFAPEPNVALVPLRSVAGRQRVGVALIRATF